MSQFKGASSPPLRLRVSRCLTARARACASACAHQLTHPTFPMAAARSDLTAPRPLLCFPPIMFLRGLSASVLFFCRLFDARFPIGRIFEKKHEIRSSPKCEVCTLRAKTTCSGCSKNMSEA